LILKEKNNRAFLYNLGSVKVYKEFIEEENLEGQTNIKSGLPVKYYRKIRDFFGVNQI